MPFAERMASVFRLTRSERGAGEPETVEAPRIAATFRPGFFRTDSVGVIPGSTKQGTACRP
jgi:hypothetical protein